MKDTGLIPRTLNESSPWYGSCDPSCNPKVGGRRPAQLKAVSVTPSFLLQHCRWVGQRRTLLCLKSCESRWSEKRELLETSVDGWQQATRTSVFFLSFWPFLVACRISLAREQTWTPTTEAQSLPPRPSGRPLSSIWTGAGSPQRLQKQPSRRQSKGTEKGRIKRGQEKQAWGSHGKSPHLWNSTSHKPRNSRHCLNHSNTLLLLHCPHILFKCLYLCPPSTWLSLWPEGKTTGLTSW